MKVLVVGAGAVGSYYGGRLALGGHDVTLIGRPVHMKAVRDRGLTIESKITGTHNIKLDTSENVFASKPPDLVLLSVKSFDTDASAKSLLEIIGPESVVLCLQNGIDNHETAARILGSQRVHPTVIYVGVRIKEAGTIEHVTRGEIILPQALALLVPVFENAGLPAKTSDNILGMVWSKLLLNASCNALGMISGASFGELARNVEAVEVMRGAVDEVVRVAAAKGVRIPGENYGDQVLRTAESLGPGVSSMLQDYRAGKRIEIDALNGVVVRMGKEFGISTPYNATLYAAGKLMQEQSRKRDSQ